MVKTRHNRDLEDEAVETFDSLESRSSARRRKDALKVSVAIDLKNSFVHVDKLSYCLSGWGTFDVYNSYALIFLLYF